MNVYDFDGTIYDGDSSFDFICFILKKEPKLMIKLAPLLPKSIDFFLKKINLTKYKENIFKIFGELGGDRVLELLDEFWEIHQHKVKAWYSETQQEDDVLISASPEFMLEPICRKIGIKYLIASPVDYKTGLFTGPNCRDHQKVIRFYEEFPDAIIDTFYSDSNADLPLARIAKQSIKVKKNQLQDWILL